MSEQALVTDVTAAQWNTLRNSLYPGASDDSIRMVIDYCVARKLDPLKKPCHLVPMNIKDAKGNWGWRDVVMPGIYELRTTAMRTGLYVGQDEPEFGPAIEYQGVTAPEWCRIIVRRYSELAHQAVAFTGVARFAECVGTKKDGKVNDRWSRAPYQMLEKCAEAAALRKAFPDEIGGDMAAEEMEGQPHVERDITPPKRQPKPETRAPKPKADANGKINPQQLNWIIGNIAKNGIPETEFLAHFEINAIVDLPFERAKDAQEWIRGWKPPEARGGFGDELDQSGPDDGEPPVEIEV